MELNSPIAKEFRLLQTQKKGLEKLGLASIRDLLFHFPTRYTNPGDIRQIQDLAAGEQVSIIGKISDLTARRAFRTKRPMGEATLEDHTGKINVIWFNQPYLAKMINDGQVVKATGRITEGKSGLYLANPEIEHMDTLVLNRAPLFSFEEENEQFLYPTYKEARGITSRWIYHSIKKIFKSGILDKLEDYIAEDILKRYNLPLLKTALIWIHTPRAEKDSRAARKRFAFEEVFFIQLSRKLDRVQWENNKSFKIKIAKKDIKDFVSRFPFSLTGAQKRAIDHIIKDVAKPSPMSRLLEGDVGSGKTAVASSISYCVVANRPPSTTAQGKQQDFGNLQVAYMAPTEILANQHFESFIEYFKHLPIQVGLITSSGCKKFPSKVPSKIMGAAHSEALAKEWTTISRNQLLKWVGNGEIPILIGTHSLIQKTVKFKDLALVIIDEQHRFGTKQRSSLVRKDGFTPHLLSMTATPIPRTLALTIYGDLDLTLIDEMPAGRKEIITDIVSPEKRIGAYEKIKGELDARRQLYVICPRIDEPDPTRKMAIQAKSVKAEAQRLKKEIFPDAEIDILHSKLGKVEKVKVMKRFEKGEVDILCATSVVEVGVNVPNATCIVIEGAERFGLAQLHQLRGRVLRSTHQAYCFVFSDSKSKKTLDRLRALKTAKNGFELSELDLQLRGAGELTGAKQWGISDIGMEAIKNIKMVEAARTEAQEIIKKDPELENHPELKSILEEKNLKIHFE